MINESEVKKERPVEGKCKERKPMEEKVVLLRRELQMLYESLREKNEQLLYFEENLISRDVQIKNLKQESKEFNDSNKPICSTCHKKCLIANDQNGRSETVKAQSETRSPDALLKLHKDLKDREVLIKELNRKIIRLSDNLIFVQKESLAKDDRIDELQRQMDKFRQVVRPFTKAAVLHRNSEDFFPEPGVENTRVILASEPSRLKRTAIRFITSLIAVQRMIFHTNLYQQR